MSYDEEVVASEEEAANDLAQGDESSEAPEVSVEAEVVVSPE